MAGGALGHQVLAQRAARARRTTSALPEREESRPTGLLRPADLLRLQSTVGNQAVSRMLAQRYYEPQVGNSKAKYRFSDNDGIALKAEQAEGGRQVWATRELMDSANTALKSAGSAIKARQGRWRHLAAGKWQRAEPGRANHSRSQAAFL